MHLNPVDNMNTCHIIDEDQIVVAIVLHWFKMAS